MAATHVTCNVHTEAETEFEVSHLGGTDRDTLRIGAATIFFYPPDLVRLRDAIDHYLAQPKSVAA